MTQSQLRADESSVVEVANRIYAYVQPDGSWWINNSGFIVGERTVIGIDSCSTESRTRRYLDSLRKVTELPVRTLVNTHHHGDHTHGNYLFEEAVVVGHDECRALILATGLPNYQGIWNPVEWGHIALSPPTITFSEGVRLWSDEVAVDVRHVGRPAHTTNDCLVWLESASVLFCGDLLFNGGTPFALMGSVVGTIDALENVIKPLHADVIVPGHGPICDGALIDESIPYLQFVLDTARRGLDENLTPLEIAQRTDLGPYAEWLDSERIVGNLHRAYVDLEPWRDQVDVLQAFADMVTYNGGVPLSCHA
jgi:cyclase